MSSFLTKSPMSSIRWWFWPAAAVLLALSCSDSSLDPLPYSERSLDHLVSRAPVDSPAFDELRRRAGVTRPAQWALAELYADAFEFAVGGDLVWHDVLRVGVDAGDPPAVRHYGRLLAEGVPGFGLEPSPDLAVRFLERAFALGETAAGVDLCRAHVHGWDGVRPVLSEPGGSALCESLAFNGGLDALVLAGDLHRLGVDVPVDPVRARGFYSVAARDGAVEALRQLGELALADSGPDGGPTAALPFFQQAAVRGSEPALYSAVGILEDGPIELRDDFLLLRLWDRAWRSGGAAGAWGLARAFACGYGVPASAVEAAHWRSEALAASPPSPRFERFYAAGCDR